MFQRRVRKSIGRRTRDLLWPRAGWGRSSRYIGHRLMRLPGSPHGIAAGFSCGVAVCFTPFLGLQVAMAMAMAWAMGASVVAAVVGTAAGNPWTLPLIWVGIYRLGAWMVGSPQAELPPPLTAGYLLEHPWQVLLPMAIGSAPAGLAAWVLSYYPLKRLIAVHRERKSAKRSARLRRENGP